MLQPHQCRNPNDTCVPGMPSSDARPVTRRPHPTLHGRADSRPTIDTTDPSTPGDLCLVKVDSRNCEPLPASILTRVGSKEPTALTTGLPAPWERTMGLLCRCLGQHQLLARPSCMPCQPGVQDSSACVPQPPPHAPTKRAPPLWLPEVPKTTVDVTVTSVDMKGRDGQLLMCLIAYYDTNSRFKMTVRLPKPARQLLRCPWPLAARGAAFCARFGLRRTSTRDMVVAAGYVPMGGPAAAPYPGRMRAGQLPCRGTLLVHAGTTQLLGAALLINTGLKRRPGVCVCVKRSHGRGEGPARGIHLGGSD